MSTSEAAIGTCTGPRPRKGWPKAKTESPSTSVTVASAARRKSPSTRTAATEPPATSVGAGPSAASPEGTSGPSQRAIRLSTEGAKPAAVQARPEWAPKARAGWKRASSRSTRSVGIRPTARSARATGGVVAAPGGGVDESPATPEAAAGIRRMAPIGVMPAIASRANGQLKATAPASRPSK